MKKKMFFAAVAALVSLASCQKEDITDNKTDQKISPVFTASIAGSTKTTVDLSDGKVAWEEADEITVTDGASISAVYAIESIDATTGKATFVIKDGETALGDGPYTAIYGTEPATAQTYSATAGKLYMTAPATTTNSFEFTVQCGLMKLNLTKTGESVKSIAVTSSTDATYTLTCDPAESIASAKDFCIALPAGSYTKIEITNSSDAKATLNSASGVEVAANHIKPVTIGESKLNFMLNIPDGALPGVFSVSATKKVYFSQGNLWADSSNELHFEEAQWNTIPTSDGIMDTDHVSHFIWAGKVSEAVGNGYLGGNLFCDESHKVSVDGSDAIYYALSKDEWTYLFKTRTVNGYTGEDKSYSFYIIFGGKIGLVLYPDNYSGTVLSGTVETLPQGVVFLPAAGCRYDSDVYDIDSMGNYWSSSAWEEDTTTAFTMEFDWGRVNTPYGESICMGYSIRLVTDVK